MTDRTRGYAHRADVAADAKRVWRALTEPAALAQWCAPDADIRPRAGGSFRATVDRVTAREALIDVFEPARRLRLIYLPLPELPPADTAMVDDFILAPGRTGTVVRLLGSGFPDGDAWNAHYRRLRAGWERALARLKVLVERQLREGTA